MLTFDDLIKAMNDRGIEAINAETIEKLINSLPELSLWRGILLDKPQEFLLPSYSG